MRCGRLIPAAAPIRSRDQWLCVESEMPMIVAPTRLHWTFEDGPEDTDYDEDPDDVGPARICRSDGTEEQVNGGEWITRAEALRLATQFGYELDEDG